MSEYIIALLKCKGIGNVKVMNFVLKYNKNITDIIKHLNEIVSSSDIELFNNYLEDAKIEILQNKNNGINIISILDNNYPNKLLMIKEPILYLYYKGDISLLHNTSIAIIGSRNITKEDEILTRNVAKKVSEQGITVVSGLALGTDANAHIGSLSEKGKTIAVLPSGLNIIAPSSNKKIFDNILKNNGLIISEYTYNMPPTKYTFVKRDRIETAVSDAVMVIKANENSGTMNAVRTALDSKKYVTQYYLNINKYIFNKFKNEDNDIFNVIKEAKKQEYDIKINTDYKQKSLFD